jgi:hypothetical protein
MRKWVVFLGGGDGALRAAFVFVFCFQALCFRRRDTSLVASGAKAPPSDMYSQQGYESSVVLFLRGSWLLGCSKSAGGINPAMLHNLLCATVRKIRFAAAVYHH